MRDQFKRLGGFNVFPILSFLLAAYFFYAFALGVGASPWRALDGTSATYLALATLFFLLPEAARFTRTKAGEYQEQLREAKDEIQDLKSETRALMSAYNGLISSIGNSTNQLLSLNTLPNLQDVKEARQALNAALGEEMHQDQLAAEIALFLNEEDSDLESALWDLRRVMEKELRRILRQEYAAEKSDGSTRFLSASALFDEFLKKYPNYGAMFNAYHYVLKICDGALQGREIPDSFVREAFQMGFRILGALRQIAPAQASQAA